MTIRRDRNQGLCIGTYRKPVAKFLRWFLSRSKGFNVVVVFRGRGTPINGARYFHGTPLSQARKVAVYIKPKKESAEVWRMREAQAYREMQ